MAEYQTGGTFGGQGTIIVSGASGTLYATLDELKLWLELPPEDDGLMDDHLTSVLLAAGRWIDQQCGRHFSLESGVEKFYYPNNPNTLDVLDLVSVTSLDLDTDGDRTYATTLAPADYELLPFMDESGRPSARYQQVQIWPSSQHVFTPGELVRIVGNFGYAIDGSPPAEIHVAALMLASRWWKRHETVSGTAFVPDMGNFDRIAEDPDVKALLDTYSLSSSSAAAWVLV